MVLLLFVAVIGGEPEGGSEVRMVPCALLRSEEGCFKVCGMFCLVGGCEGQLSRCPPNWVDESCFDVPAAVGEHRELLPCEGDGDLGVREDQVLGCEGLVRR